MEITAMKTRLAWLILACLPAQGFSQQPNLLANNSFEDVNTCTEYHAQCAPAAWFIVTTTKVKWPPPKDGESVMPIVYDDMYAPMTGRTFPYTMLLCPLKAGREYDLSFWLYTGEFPFTHLDVVLTHADPTRAPSVIGKIIPSFSLSKSDVLEKDKDGWMRVRKRFTVDEEKRFFLIGNVMPSGAYPHSVEKKLKRPGSGLITFCIDDINLSAVDTTEIMCPSFAYTHSIVYEEHHRHTRHIFLDSLPANSIPLQSSHDTLTGVQAPPPLFIPPPADTLLIPGVYFATNSSEIKSIYARQLDSLIAKIGLKKLVSMEIDGHTDNTASDEFNDALSLRRAASIRDFILTRLPDLRDLIAINGFGSRRPVATNDTPAGKAKNRRVEIVLSY
ncbi:OmpA family protein [Flavitalea sp. BT771]|uniref:OmpA family protein n=1 Tax=Flavitalea sp. BT771 TaxID=3063329 RepID=UPI0026E492CD|nr:OmpA family protein [Flavitalea sp. BT771]MDO6429227.1 OmpA family protein [Flavitalea sp. BT771]MDV6218645.1 OmpA family protein [Flavitalea sp. BT771]